MQLALKVTAVRSTLPSVAEIAMHGPTTAKWALEEVERD